MFFFDTINIGGYGMKADNNIRQSNIELYRIILILFIIMHHLVVNSGLLNVVELYDHDLRNIYTLILGCGGKIAVNSFLIITGYFMCKSNITKNKFFKLLFEILFYNIVLYFFFLIMGYIQFDFKNMIFYFFPFKSLSNNFIDCYLVFFILIPYINKLISKMNKKEFKNLLFIIMLFFVILPSFNIITTINYVFWFIVMYLVGAYLRLYTPKIFLRNSNNILLTITSFIGAICSIVLLYFYSKNKMFHPGYYYFWVADVNKIFAILPAVTSFILFKNIKIKYNKIINTLARSTFGVLLIHANSDTMRYFLWHDVFLIPDSFYNKYYYLYILGTVIVVYIICIIIDYLRISFIEKKYMNFLNLTN